jgi:hypothetical protein
MHIQTWPARVAEEAAQVPTITQRRWIDTGVAPLRNNDRRVSGSGHAVGLSRNRILQFAITQALLKNGVSLSRAARAALEFSDYGNNGRPAGQCFQRGKTALVLSSNSATVCNLDFNSSVFDISNDGVSIVVDCNKVVAAVDSVLNNSKH